METQQNKKNKNVVVLFIYPNVESYLEPLVLSLNNQTSKEYSVMIFNDGLKSAELLFENLDNNHQIINISGTIKEIRQEAFKLLKESDVGTIIFQDSDDFMSNNRVEVCLDYLKTYSLVCNDLDLIDTEGNLIREGYWTDRLSNSFIFDYNFIKKFNIVGLGNTAIRKELLDNEIQFSSDAIIALDWFIFYQLLEKSKEQGVFVNTCKTIYRQHQNNEVGLGEFSKKRLKHAINVKKAHYNALNNVGFHFENELNELEKINTNQENFFKINNNKSLFWWEETEQNYEIVTK
jgi:hypothetical protein